MCGDRSGHNENKLFVSRLSPQRQTRKAVDYVDSLRAVTGCDRPFLCLSFVDFTAVGLYNNGMIDGGTHMLTTAPMGTKDILPGESAKWQYMERVIREACAAFGYREIRIPTFEHTELFLRSVGNTTDIVQKEMYTFEDKGGRSITLKPEGTAGVARAFVEHSLYNEPLPLKCYYLYNSCFRYERPQAGRLREFHQFGVEAFGAQQATVDAEVILLSCVILGKMGLANLTVNLNSIGCPVCRPKYHETLLAYLREKQDGLCHACKERIERNPLRVLDCKEEGCHAIAKDAPKSMDHLCEDCHDHFETLKTCLTDAGVDYIVNPFIVRGLDYYTKTVFEIISADLGAQSTLCGGGRYDGLIEEVGGPKTPGIGFGMGMERLLMVLEAQGKLPPDLDTRPVFIAAMGDEARLAAWKLAMELRQNGVAAECDHMGRSLKAQFKYAGKLGCPQVVVVGEQELATGQWKLKDMTTGEERTVERASLVTEWKGIG